MTTPSDVARAFMPDPKAPFMWGFIQNIDPGPPASVMVTIGGSSTIIIGVAYGVWYAPEIGDEVLMTRDVNGYLFVFGPRA